MASIRSATKSQPLLGGYFSEICFKAAFLRTAGSAIVTVKSINVTTGVKTTVGTVTVTYGAAAVVSSTLSTAFIGQGNACAVAANTVPIRNA